MELPSTSTALPPTRASSPSAIGMSHPTGMCWDTQIWTRVQVSPSKWPTLCTGETTSKFFMYTVRIWIQPSFLL
jgi:hypothetical protein